MPPILPRGGRQRHSKSRSGCRSCKDRKVKCGEERPSCQNCQRRGISCSFTSTAARLPLARALPILAADAAGNSSNSTGSFAVLDLELLHHYTVSTAATLSSEPIVRSWFQVEVPQLAFTHPFVLSSVLALAASHLAHFRPEARRRYATEAAARHTVATSLASPLLSKITASNAVPLYCFSILTLFISFASRREDEELFSRNDSVVPSWLNLFRGVRTVLESNNRHILTSKIAFLFGTSTTVNKKWDSHQSEPEALEDFRTYIVASATTTNATLATTAAHRSIETLTEEQSNYILEALVDLKRAYYAFYGSTYSSTATATSNNNAASNNPDGSSTDEAKTRSIFTWMYKLSDGYVSMLRARQPDALCLLAFFGVLLHRLEHKWWLRGWGVHLVSRIHAAVNDAHRFWLRWPILEIGWIPPVATEP
ncbi:uncharacterized protein B0I36DRAFT_291401 [Microdochium trichocladiopsis]|uniref:Zn(2)-C6 fungal-type domain-containing protein n=1 Tax=Microdochium trichocladiopsis TaxID=1682393 RepID=A0A9P8Y4M0_9PEZI|nr:uncharacterized protein B0I36DRAFT_291401 [Microdochium trichocladiopsis]KAH7029596.1 hypothetical protein B0I36DRAFT_291401 [Microdochium trichocladiopsis]